MASRFYGLNRGQTEFQVAEASSTGTKDAEVVVDLSKNLVKGDVYTLIDIIRDRIIRELWPAKAVADFQVGFGLDRGQREVDVVIAAAAYAALTNQTIVYTAKLGGVAGNGITLALVDPPGNNVPLSVAVVGSAITVTLATDGSSAITTTRAQLVAAINADAAAFALLAAVGSGATVITALSATNLTTGAAPATGGDVAAIFKTGTSLSRAEALQALKMIQNHIIKNIWPPA